MDWNTPAALPVPPATVPLIRTVPFVELVIVSSFSKITPAEPVTSNEVLAVIVVKSPVVAELAPIAAPSIAPPSISTASKFAVPSIYRSLNSTELLPRSAVLSAPGYHAVTLLLPMVTLLSATPVAL